MGDVIRVLQNHGSVPKPTVISSIRVGGAGLDAVNGEYHPRPPNEIPAGFRRVCEQQVPSWDSELTWQTLGGGLTWYQAENGAYMFWNTSDRHWWIDKPDGLGAYKAL